MYGITGSWFGSSDLVRILVNEILRKFNMISMPVVVIFLDHSSSFSIRQCQLILKVMHIPPTNQYQFALESIIPWHQQSSMSVVNLSSTASNAINSILSINLSFVNSSAVFIHSIHRPIGLPSIDSYPVVNSIPVGSSWQFISCCWSSGGNSSQSRGKLPLLFTYEWKFPLIFLRGQRPNVPSSPSLQSIQIIAPPAPNQAASILSPSNPSQNNETYL